MWNLYDREVAQRVHGRVAGAGRPHSRLVVEKANARYINDFNKKDARVVYKVSLNKFSDLTLEEFGRMHVHRWQGRSRRRR